MMVPYGMDEKAKPRLEVSGTKYLFSIQDPQAEDAGFYQVDVGDANILTTDFKGNVLSMSISLIKTKAFLVLVTDLKD